MYRSAIKRIFSDSYRICNSNQRIFHSSRIVSSRYFSTPASDNLSFNAQNPNVNLNDASKAGDANDYTGSESSTHRQAGNLYEDEQTRVLRASLLHVNKLGWSEAAMVAGARDAGISPSIVGAFPRKEAALVEYFMDDCLQKLIDRIDTDESLKHLTPTERISKLLRIRLEMNAPFITRWAQALSIQAMPGNLSTSFKQRAMLVDEIWHAVGDTASDIDWYVKRTVLGGIYSSTEVYMLADNSHDFQDTWAFLDARVRDAMDLGKIMKEATRIAEAAGVDMANPLQGFARKVFEGRPFNK